VVVYRQQSYEILRNYYNTTTQRYYEKKAIIRLNNRLNSAF